MKIAIVAAIMFACLTAAAQKYEYCMILEVPNGMRAESSFVFPSSQKDSVKVYGTFKFLIDALEFASKKGWEVITVEKERSTILTTTVYLRRRKE